MEGGQLDFVHFLIFWADEGQPGNWPVHDSGVSQLLDCLRD
jgi:hypothetical protein